MVCVSSLCVFPSACVRVCVCVSRCAHSFQPLASTSVVNIPLSSHLQVHFVSDFFKKRPPRCAKADAADGEGPERKPSLQIADSDHGNHYNYHHNPGHV